jgi:hypothetical protein
MSELFLVKVVYTTTTYMNNESKEKEVTHIVEANDKKDAETKAKEYYDAKSRDYEIYYNVQYCIVSEMIK